MLLQKDFHVSASLDGIMLACGHIIFKSYIRKYGM